VSGSPVSEVLVGLDRQLLLVIGGAHPGPADLHPPTTECHRPALVPVPLRRPIRVVLALRTDDLVDLALHQLMNDGQTETDRQREQPLPRCPDQLAQRLLDLRR
jgi:hypothetical protein